MLLNRSQVCLKSPWMFNTLHLKTAKLSGSQGTKPSLKSIKWRKRYSHTLWGKRVWQNFEDVFYIKSESEISHHEGLECCLIQMARVLFSNPTLRVISAFPTSAQNLVSGSTPAAWGSLRSGQSGFLRPPWWARPTKSTSVAWRCSTLLVAWEMPLKVCVKHD